MAGQTHAEKGQGAAGLRLSDVWRDFCAKLAESADVLDRPAAPGTPLDQAEGLRYLSRLTRTAMNMLIDSADPDFPRMFLMNDDTVGIGADNPDNIYHNIVVRGDRDYRISGKPGTVPYLSIGSKADRYTVDGTMASTGEIELAGVTLAEDGSFDIIASQTKQPGNWLPMEADTTLLMVRQTFNDKTTEIPADFRVERISDGPAAPALLTPEVIQAQLSKTAAWVRGAANTFADWSEWFMGEPNRFYEGKDQSVYIRAGGDPRI